MGGRMLVWIINLLKQGDYTEWDAQMPLPDYTTDSIRDEYDFCVCVNWRISLQLKQENEDKSNRPCCHDATSATQASLNSLCSPLITTGTSMDLSIMLIQGATIYAIKNDAANPSGYRIIIWNFQFYIILLV